MSWIISGVMIFVIIMLNSIWIENAIVDNINKTFKFKKKRYVVHKDLHEGRWGYIVFDKMSEKPASSHGSTEYTWYPSKERAETVAAEWNELHAEDIYE